MFSIAICIYTIGMIAFLIFGECEIQTWAKTENLQVERKIGDEKTPQTGDPEADETIKFIDNSNNKQSDKK